ncbi:cadherin-like domain-containing protein [Hydrogenovibrio thermophilus]|uniref:Tandem-95 repeat protein n=1 Tax=Hydrogenovibrio thermophilus TaxID=265883 RepID=A0A451G4B1_9GAMM|nr:cadherin-like domain-containing protein [Hydrogenovibrio thermophilus]QAB14303.1 tandem-95 repeat protein [Hydrogenovibrio thermophilus]
MNLTVTPDNDMPVAVDDSASTTEDTALTISAADMLSNDSDIDGDTLSIDSFTQPANGTLVDNGDGTFSYTPNADYNGTDSFTYTVSDGNGGTDTATVNLTVTPDNDMPVAVDDSASTTEDTALTISAADMLSNDSDIDGDTLSIDSFTQPANGTLVDNGDGTFSYTPNADYNGTDSFTYTVSDGNGGTDTATVNLTVTPDNDMPVAVDDSASTTEDTALTISAADMLSNDSDIDGDTLSIDSFTQPANGTLVDNGDGTFSYTPNADYNGTDSFTYTVSDGNGGTDTATVNLTVTPDNDMPVAVDDSASTTEDTALTISAADMLSNDSDIDGDTLSIDSFTQPANGTLVDNGDGTFSYTPNADYNGTDSFTYTVSDGNGGTDTATVNLTVTPDNDMPVAVDDSASTTEDTALTISAADMLSNDSDIDGDTLSIDSFTQPANGTLVDNGDGTFSYTPNADYNGTDSFTYTVSDGNGGTDTATVNLTVTPDNDMPVAVDDSASTTEDTALTISAADMLSNDSDIDGDTLSIDSFTQPANGTLVDNGDGTFSYTPNADYNGTDSFTYTVSDGNGGTDTATVNLTVTPDNDMPVAVDDSASTTEDTALTISAADMLSNDSDIDGDTLSIDSFTQPANGTLVDNGDGTFSYTPNADYNGTDSFTYTVSDGNGGTDTATVNLTVTPDNDMPVAVDDSASTTEDTALTISAADMLSNDSDIDGDTLSIDSFTQPANGTLVDNGDGTFSYTPNADYNGTDSFTYTVSDGNGGTDTATVNLTVTPDNDMPVAVDDSASTTEDTALTISAADMLSNDSDIDGDTLSIDSFTQPANGTLVDNGDGTFSYTPNADYNGTDSFTYTVSDGNGGTDTATVNLTVTPDNDMPVAVDDSASTTEDTAFNDQCGGHAEQRQRYRW